jgi:hypothetical protein
MLLQKAELRRRVESRRIKLENDLARLKTDSAGKAAEKIEKIELSLARLRVELRAGWDSLSDGVIRRLKHWLDEK